MKNYQDINAETIDRWIDQGWKWGQPISHEEYLAALNGRFSIYLKKTKTVPANSGHALQALLNQEKALNKQ